MNTAKCIEYRGVPFARAGRFEYAELAGLPEDLSSFRADRGAGYGPACPQYRQLFPHMDNPERLFYHREFREGLSFDYSEDCLNLNIFAPEGAENCPVLLFYYGGGFNSGANSEEPFRGEGLASRGIITVFANYRVGVLGYITHEEIQKEYGRDGNFGLDDQRCALLWVRKNIARFGGDPDNITIGGQSAGAISTQYQCLNRDNEGLFRRAFMMSGGGMFPKFALPKKLEDNRPYWLELMKTAGCGSFAELKSMDLKDLLAAEETLKNSRKDTIYYTMPVVDGKLLKKPVDQLIGDPLKLSYLIGYTNNDMYAPAMAYIGNRFGRANGAYIYYFDIDLPGDGNGAFHSCDLRYTFERLDSSWRPFGQHDRQVSELMADYLANFVRSGDPNGEGLPEWTPVGGGKTAVMCHRPQGSAMGHPSYIKMIRNMLSKGSPKAEVK